MAGYRNRRRERSLPVTQDELLAELPLLETDTLCVEIENEDFEHFMLRVGTTLPRGHYPSDAARHRFTERFPEKRVVAQSLDCLWRVPTTDVSAILIRDLWPESQVTFSPEAEVTYRYLLASIQQQRSSVDRSAAYHSVVESRPAVRALGVPVPEPAPQFVLRGEKRPMLHQRVARENALNREGYALFMEQGTGKTAVVIGRVDAEAPAVFAQHERMYRALIVAPKNVRSNWENEFNAFSTVPGKVTVLRGGQMERVRLLIEAMIPTDGEQYSVVVMSYECMCIMWDTLKAIEWDLSVLDESHAIKWPRTKRAMHALKLRDVSRQRMCLTGTPICNTPIDLYAQLEFLVKGGSGFHSFEAFRHFYGVFETVDSQRGIKRLVDVQNMPFMQERLARMAFVVRKSEALPDLPSKSYIMREVEMTPAQAETYRMVQTQLFLEIKNEMDDSTRTMNANNVLTRLLRLAQITSGFVTFDPIVDLDTGEVMAPKVVEAFEPNPKLEDLVELLKERPDDEKTLVWACWIHDIQAISERLEQEGIEHVTFYGATSDAMRKVAEERFNSDPTCRVLVANQACGGTGLNLLGYDWWNNPNPTQATDTTMEVFMSQTWSSPQRSQAEDRPCRNGQRRPVQIVDLMVPMTIDEEIRARVTNKRHMALQVQDLRDVLGRVLGRTV